MRLKSIDLHSPPPGSRPDNRDGVTLWARFWCWCKGGRDAASALAELQRQLAEAQAALDAQEQELATTRRALEQQRAMHKRLSMAVEAVNTSPWEMDLRTRQFVWDYNRPKAFGLDHVPIHRLADELRKLISAQDVEQIRLTIEQALAGEIISPPYVFRATRADGTTAHMRGYVSVIRDAQGTPVSVMGATSDITGEVQTTELLHKQAEQERRLLDRLSVATQAAAITSWELDLVSKRFLWIENSIESLNGSSGKERELATLAERVYPEDRPLFMQEIRAAANEGRDNISYRWRCYNAAGALIHMQSHARLYFNDVRRATRALGVSWEITEEIEAAEQMEQQAQQLRDTQRRLERASVSSSEGHWEWDFLQETAWYSTSYHKLLGYEPGQLGAELHESLRQLQHPDDIDWQLDKFKRHVRDGDAYEFECRLRLSNGEYRWVHVRGTAERDAQGKPIAMSGSIQDIHQQKEIEDALRLAQRRLERAVTGTQDGLWELETDGQAWCSPRVLELLGYAHDELSNHTNFMREFLHPDDVQAVVAATQAHFQQSIPYDVEVRLRTKSAEYRWYRARATAERDADGRALRLSGSLQEVTDARAARDALLRATEAAEAANRAKSSFLANVSHEIRTPMNGIIGMTGLLLDTSLDRTQRDYADTIRSSADSLLTVINDILDFSKIEAGKLVIESLELDPRSTLEDVATMMAFQAADKNLEIIVKLDAAVPRRVMGDPQRLRQCLINLLGNAVKFTRAGEIVLEVSAEQRAGAAHMRFEVRDTGMGIAQSALDTLFQPFVQADSSTTRHFGGTGLGLSIVQRLANMMGGHVGASSEVGKGSTFWFTLPMTIVADGDAAAPLDMARVGRSVLIVDDNATSRNALADQLKPLGYEVTLAPDGAAALSLLQAAVKSGYPYEIVLADYLMPGMDGMALGEKIKAEPSLARSRVIMLTPVNRHGDMRRLGVLGFDGYLTKPVRVHELLSLLEQVMMRDSGEWHLLSQPVASRKAVQTAASAAYYAGKVLLAEDNLVNQKVATRFLERLGCTVRVVNNGVEAVAACHEERFALILMDLQMPVMDGLTATRLIRELEGSGRQTPIAALTANAMVGQLETCLKAGMNGFLTKPLEVACLRETLDRFGLGVAEGVTTGVAGDCGVGTPATVAPINLARLREITEGDSEFTLELAQTFITSGAAVIDELKRAHAALDRIALARAAHKLKGASANIHAESLHTLSSTMESQAVFAEEPVIAAMLSSVECEYRSVVRFFNEHAGLTPEREKEVS